MKMATFSFSMREQIFPSSSNVVLEVGHHPLSRELESPRGMFHGFLQQWEEVVIRTPLNKRLQIRNFVLLYRFLSGRSPNATGTKELSRNSALTTKVWYQRWGVILKVPSHKIVRALARIFRLSSVEKRRIRRPSEWRMSHLTSDSSGSLATRNQFRLVSSSAWVVGAAGMNSRLIL